MNLPPIEDIIVIDDDALISDFLSFVLKQRGIKARITDNGQDGIKEFKKKKPDLALIDLRLPDIHGFEVISAIREKDEETPIIVISGTGTIQDAIEAIRRGAWDFMIKPFPSEKVIYHAIDKAFEKAQLIKENKDYQEHLEEQVAERTVELQKVNNDLREINERLKMIVEATNKMAACTDFNELSRVLLEEFARNMAAVGGSLYIKVENAFKLVHTLDLDRPLPTILNLPFDDKCILNYVIENKEPLLIEDISKHGKFNSSGWKGYKDESLIVFPVLNDLGELFAAISLHNKRTPPFKKQDIEIGKILISYTYEALKANEATNELKQSEARYRSVVEDQTECIVRYFEDGTRTFVNDSYCRFFGRSRTDLKGTSLFDVIYDEDIPKLKKKIKLLSVENYVLVDEIRVKLPNGKIGWQQWTDRAILDANNKIIEYQAVGIDISQRKAGEEALKNALQEVEHLKNQLEAENVYLQEEIKLDHNFEEIIGKSDKMKEVFRQVKIVAPNDTTVLINGETGTGKELIARAIHSVSRRKNRPLVKVNCAALPPNLIESELFGHEKGAFTGAHTKRKGRFELADSGTLFLDEISEIPLDLQIKLLRVIQEGEFELVGGEDTISVNVRLIAATNRDLKKAIKENKFREDLYYRLNVIPIDLPPLRERKEDIKDLTLFFAHKYGRKMGKSFNSISKDALTKLTLLNWPGNIRELENIIERSVIFSEGPTLEIAQPIFSSLIDNKINNEIEPTLSNIEKHHILKILEQTKWVIEGDFGAAKILDLHPNTLRSRMKKLQIHKDSL